MGAERERNDHLPGMTGAEREGNDHLPGMAEAERWLFDRK